MTPSASPPDFVDLRIAAFGTLSNGSDVRLLARPAEGDLSEEAKATIEALFYAAWKAVGARRAPYFLFTPLDANLWGLCQVRQLGRGAIGEVLVVWVALLDVAQLDSIDWATHRLFYSAFPDAAGLPAPNTRLPTHRAQILKDQSPEVQAYDAAFDQAAFKLIPNPGRVAGWHAHISVEPPADATLTPLSPEGVLFGLFDRLGRWRADLSYCTWAGLESFGFPRAGEAFHLVLSEPPTDPTAGAGNRIVLKLGAATEAPDLAHPHTHWQATREINAGVQEVVDTQPRPSATPSSPADDAYLADLMFDRLQAQLLGDAPIGRLAQLAQKLTASKTPTAELQARVLPLVLMRTLEARREGRPARARALDDYVRDVLPVLDAGFPTQRHRHQIAEIALDLDLPPLLNANSFDTLAGEFFGGSADPGLTDVMITKVRALSEKAAGDWTFVLQRLLRHEDGPGRRRLLPPLIARTFGQPQGRPVAEEALVQLILEGGLAAAVPVLDAGADLPTRQALFVQLAARRGRPSGATSRRYLSDRLTQLQLLKAGRALGEPRRSRG